VSCARLARFFQLPILKNNKENSTKENTHININNASFSWDTIIHNDKDVIERTFVQAVLSNNKLKIDIDVEDHNSNENHDNENKNTDYININNENDNNDNGDKNDNDNDNVDVEDTNDSKYTLKNINFATSRPNELIAIIGTYIFVIIYLYSFFLARKLAHRL
jgi:hypothetical protein